MSYENINQAVGKQNHDEKESVYVHISQSVQQVNRHQSTVMIGA